MQESRKALEEQLQFRRVLESEVETLRSSTVNKQDHTRLMEAHAKEAARIAAARVETEFSIKSQVQNRTEPAGSHTTAMGACRAL